MGSGTEVMPEMRDEGAGSPDDRERTVEGWPSSRRFGTGASSARDRRRFGREPDVLEDLHDDVALGQAHDIVHTKGSMVQVAHRARPVKAHL